MKQAEARHIQNRQSALRLGCGALAVVYVVFLLRVESQLGVLLLLLGGLGAVLSVARFGMLRRLAAGMREPNIGVSVSVVIAALIVTGYLYDDHFVLLLIATVMLFIITALGINIQFGYAGVVNFAGAAFFGIGGYTAAVLAAHTVVPHVLILVLAGGVAALIGTLVILPVLRTRGHYSAVITIAFTILFSTFLEVNDVLGGPQGLPVAGLRLFGWDLNENIMLGEAFEASFYVNYIIVSLILLVVIFTLVRRLERSWIGLNWDVVRLDETAAACFGLNIIRWKITAFTLGNFVAGVAGALYAMMIGFIAPQNFTFADSLILVSIVLLGGLGNPWGVVLASSIVIIVPEKLQAIQEYRFLIFGLLVMLMLLYRPKGLMPRPPRTYVPRWRST